MKTMNRRGLQRLLGYMGVLVLVAACAGPTTQAPAATGTSVPQAPAATVAPAQATAVPQVAAPTEIPYPAPAAGVQMVDTTQWKKSPPWTIAYANASASNSWRIFTVAALYAEASQYPDLIKDIVVTNANDSVPKQVSDMEDLMVKGVDAIILAATSGSALVPAVDKAMAQGIPVIILERGIDSQNYATYVDVNPAASATAQAEWMVKQLGGQGNVVFIGIIPGLTISKIDEDAVRAVWAKNPGIKELAFDYGKVSRSNSKALMEAWLRAYPKIDGVIAWTGTDIEGAVEAAKEAGRYDEIKAWAGADEMDYLKMIKEGLPGMGYVGYADCTIDALHAAMRILQGQPVPKTWALPAPVIYASNIDQYYIPGAPGTWYPSRIPSDQVQKWLDFAATK